MCREVGCSGMGRRVERVVWGVVWFVECGGVLVFWVFGVCFGCVVWSFWLWVCFLIGFEGDLFFYCLVLVFFFLW